MADDTGYVKGYEKVSSEGKSPHAASGTEKTNQEKGPGPDWAKREK